MTNKQVATIIGAIILTGLVIVFLPGVISRYNQSRRDDSMDCKIYRLTASVNRVRQTRGEYSMADRIQEDQQRMSGGCSPY